MSVFVRETENTVLTDHWAEYQATVSQYHTVQGEAHAMAEQPNTPNKETF